MGFIFRLISHNCRPFLHFRPSSIARSSISNSYFCTLSNEKSSTSSAQVDLKNPQFSSQLQLKKRPFTDEEQRSNFGKLVYKSDIENQVYWCKTISLSTSITTILISPYIAHLYLNDPNQSMGKIMLACWTAFSAAFIFTPFLMNYLTKKLVLEMYYNGDLYTAIFYNILIKKRALQFRAQDVRAIDPATVFLHTHQVGNHLLLLGRTGFKDADVWQVFNESQDFQSEKDDDDDANDEPAKSMADHHKRQQDQ